MGYSGLDVCCSSNANEMAEVQFEEQEHCGVGFGKSFGSGAEVELAAVDGGDSVGQAKWLCWH